MNGQPPLNDAVTLLLAAGADDELLLSDGASLQLSRHQVRQAVSALAQALRQAGVRRLALLADNGPAWLIADLAALQAERVLIPLPPFFTPAQMAHVLASAGVDALLGPAAAMIGLGFNPLGVQPDGAALQGLRLGLRPVSTQPPLPAGTAKITFTSGTTGQPKGVCLSAAAQLRVASSIVAVCRDLPLKRHLCLLPLAVLLENVAGCYAALLAGAAVIIPPLAAVGSEGSSQFAPGHALAALAQQQASSAIVVPEMLRAMVLALEQGVPLPTSLQLLAAGGGRISPQLAGRALALGLPLHEGYGLSECASVVSLTRPGQQQPGCAGQPLPHLQLQRDEQGELLIHGNGFLGYLGEPPRDLTQPVASGDLARIDERGGVHIEGRRKQLMITGFGRNLAPEWPESELLAEAPLRQAVVFGEGQPWLAALLVVAADCSDEQLAAAVANANSRLPDYARVRRYARIPPLTAADGLLTSNGRPRRAPVASRYQPLLQQLFTYPVEELP